MVSSRRANDDWDDKKSAIRQNRQALRRAARRVLKIGLKTGTPVHVIKRGKIFDFTKKYPRKTKRK